MKKAALLLAAFAAFTLCAHDVAAQDKRTDLKQTLAQITSDMEHAGIKVTEFTQGGKLINIREFKPIRLEDCTVQIEMMASDSIGRFGGATVFLYTIPLADLDIDKTKARDCSFLRTKVEGRLSTDTSPGFTRVTLFTLDAKETIVYSAVGTRKRRSDVYRETVNLSFFIIDFKNKEVGKRVAEQFIKAARLCGAVDKNLY